MDVHCKNKDKNHIIIIIIYPLTARMAEAPQMYFMTSFLYFSLFSTHHLLPFHHHSFPSNLLCHKIDKTL